MKFNKFNILSLAAAMTLTTGLLTSCDDNDTVVEPVINIETGPSQIDLGPEEMGMQASGYLDRTKALKYVVRSNTHWTITVDGNGTDTDWLQIHPMEGNGDGIFMVAAARNEDFMPRALTLSINLDGSDTPVVIPVNQRGADPYILVSSNITINGVGGQTSIGVKSNVDWTCEVVASEDPWLEVVSYNRESIVINAQRRDVDAPRTAQIAITSDVAPEVNTTIDLIQYGPSILFYDDFEWLAGYATDNTWYDSGSPKNMKSWTVEQLQHGWTSWVGPSGSVNVYGGSVNGNGWLKLGKTNFTGTAVSPRLSSLEDGVTTDVEISFVACPYTSGGNTSTNPGNHDASNVLIGIYGPGEIVSPDATVQVNGLTGICNPNWQRDLLPDEDIATYITGEPVQNVNATYPVKKFTLVNYPNSKLKDVWLYPEPLNCPEAECMLEVKGVTNQTQIVIFGGAFDDQLNGLAEEKFTITGISGKEYTGKFTPNINRLFIDNFIVRVKQQ